MQIHLRTIEEKRKPDYKMGSISNTVKVVSFSISLFA